MHARGGEFPERPVGLVRVVDDARDDHRRRAVFQEIYLPDVARVPLVHPLQEVRDGPRDAVALRLPGYNDCVEVRSFL